MTNNLDIVVTEASKGYELIDSGEGEKLERFGSIVLSRPDPQALWPKKMPPEKWAEAHAVFKTEEGKKAAWHITKEVPAEWNIELAQLTFTLRLMAFKHVGIFPEHAENWKWIEETVSNASVNAPAPIRVLNLFGYTGGATLAALKGGAEVVHVDGSKVSIKYARENAERTGLSSKPVRWILDDAKEFVEREGRRGNVYDGIIMDPPLFGRGPKGEVWNIEHDLVPFLESVKKVLSPDPLFILLNGYASGYSALAYEYALATLLPQKAAIERGELTIRETSGGRLLPAGIFARYKKG